MIWEDSINICMYVYIYIYIYIHTYIRTYIHVGCAKKCIHTLTKENSTLYVNTNFNCTSQVEYTLQ